MATAQNLIINSTISAYAFWEKWHAAEDMSDDIAEQFENIEIFLLRSRPNDLLGCTRLLDLVLDSMRSGGRSDMLDIQLLQHVQTVMGLHTATDEDGTTKKNPASSIPEMVSGKRN